MDELDRAIVNRLQEGLPVCERPYAAAAAGLGIGEAELISRLGRLLGEGILTRFGPLYDAERLGGAFSLCAMSVPPHDAARVIELVNAHPEVAHHYERGHRLNLWFVLATEAPQGIAAALRAIERETGYPVLDLPKEAEYRVRLRLAA